MANVKSGTTTKKANKSESVAQPTTRKERNKMTKEQLQAEKEQEEKQQKESQQLDWRIKNKIWSDKNHALSYQINKELKKGEAADQELIRKLKNFSLSLDTVDKWYEELETTTIEGVSLALVHKWYQVGEAIYSSIYKFRRDQKETHISMQSTEFQEQLKAMQQEREEFKARQEELMQEIKLLKALFKDLKSDQETEETKESE